MQSRMSVWWRPIGNRFFEVDGSGEFNMSTTQFGEAVLHERYQAASDAAPSTISWCGLCATSFFLAEANGVTAPFINTYLVDRGWSYGSPCMPLRTKPANW